MKWQFTQDSLMMVLLGREDLMDILSFFGLIFSNKGVIIRVGCTSNVSLFVSLNVVFIEPSNNFWKVGSIVITKWVDFLNFSCWMIQWRGKWFAKISLVSCWGVQMTTRTSSLSIVIGKSKKESCREVYQMIL